MVPYSRVSRLYLDAVLAAMLQNSFKLEYVCMITDLHLAYRQGA